MQRERWPRDKILEGTRSTGGHKVGKRIPRSGGTKWGTRGGKEPWKLPRRFAGNSPEFQTIAV